MSLIVSGCSSSTHPKPQDLPEFPFELIRFEHVFFGDLNTPLDQLKSQYPYFFPEQTPDFVWEEKRTNSLQQALFKATQTLFKDDLKQRTSNVLRYANHYFPNDKLPRKVITLLTDVDYSLRAVDADSLLLISIDTYLGESHPLYEGIPQYIKNSLVPEHLESELIDALSNRYIQKTNSRSFLSRMVTHGKRLLIHDYLAPDLMAHQHIQYTQNQWDWAISHESDVWRYFVDNEWLFSTDESLRFRFLNLSPYSKFYSYLDENSPGRIGQWIGYRMVKAYQKRTGASLQEVLAANAQEILKKSRYNP
ncbi:MAG: gliding motility lipoprotein GldB [Bacteroidetes bacterium]|nr:gliding motility lipoprotein GldB [Bacteroidota bacterium]MDA0888826.1 gliding motility lipoprotein GldB [Bacteroidota bacterium]MDA1084589.1 gliding motility lipoprotein GldB [Bacteroidota bacterium]